MMNSDNIEASGVSVSDLPYLEHLKKDLELKRDLVGAEYGLKSAELAILGTEWERTSAECLDVLEKIDYINKEYVTKEYNEGFNDLELPVCNPVQRVASHSYVYKPIKGEIK